MKKIVKTGELVPQISECCGCCLCQYSCPSNAISMDTDDEGFWYPAIDTEKCIGCSLCLKICIMRSKRENNYDE